LQQTGCTLIPVSGVGRPDHLKGQEHIVEHALIFIQFADGIMALAGAIATLVDMALRHSDKHAKDD
jgi:hypothetical protein